MAVGDPYDSPTFLSQKDKYLFGLTLVQLVMILAVGGFYFLLTFMLPLGSMVTRLLVLVPAVGVTAVLMFVRIAGLSLPSFIFLAATVKLRNSSYEAPKSSLMRGSALWLTQLEEKGQRSRMGRKKDEVSKTMDLEQRKSEVKAEVDKAVVEGSVAAQQWVRDGINTLMKGR